MEALLVKLPPKAAFGLTQPILAQKVVHSGKLLFVIGDDDVTKCKRLGRNKQIIGADWRASLLKPRPSPSNSTGGSTRNPRRMLA